MFAVGPAGRTALIRIVACHQFQREFEHRAEVPGRREAATIDEDVEAAAEAVFGKRHRSGECFALAICLCKICHRARGYVRQKMSCAERVPAIVAPEVEDHIRYFYPLDTVL